jgi:predicted RNA-binding Zn-ribbon protein involved in translation (DUF1610 family)
MIAAPSAAATTQRVAFFTCPGCGGSELSPEPVGGEVVFRCATCGAAWRYTMGYLVAVTPAGEGSA